MNKEEVIKVIGENNWEDFSNWMRGQTVETYTDGTTNFYEHDVNRFVNTLKTKGWSREDSNSLDSKLED
jgi:hypothetical protein